MKKLLAIASIFEAITGLLLIIVPAIVVKFLIGGDIEGAGLIASRVAGCALIALSIACWPSNKNMQAFWGMLVYSTLAGLYLALLGVGGVWVGKLLWPAAATHILLSILLVFAWFKNRNAAK